MMGLQSKTEASKEFNCTQKKGRSKFKRAGPNRSENRITENRIIKTGNLTGYF